MVKRSLKEIFAANNLEVLTYINKKDLADNGVIFCILDAKKVDVPNSQFNIPEQWLLTILTPISNGEVRKFWLAFAPNETRDDFMEAITTGLEQAHKEGMKAVHSCVLKAIPLAKYDNPFYAIDFTEADCHCGEDE